MRSMLMTLVMAASFIRVVPLDARPDTQVALDRIVARVGGRIITQSDIRQARVLKLVDDTSSDDAVRRGLEDRLLMQTEMGRATPVPAPSEADLAGRRAEWEQSVGGAGAVPRLLTDSGMSEEALAEWLREDMRIRAYLRRQFGMLPEADRGRATADWISRLRQRADLR